MNDLARLHTEILSLDNGDSADIALSVLNKLEAMKQRIGELDRALKQRLIEYIKATGRDLVCGTIRYYVGTDKVTKCTNTAQALADLLEATAGDMEAVAALMSSDPWKYGAVRNVLPPDKYAVLFVTDEKDRLKEGKPKGEDKLQKIDTRFTHRRSVSATEGAAHEKESL